MTNEQKNEVISKITIDPKISFGLQFPEWATKEEKIMTLLKIEEAKRMGKPVDIDSRVKIVPLDDPKPVEPPKEPAKVETPVASVPKPVESQQSVPQPVQEPAKTESPQPTPVPVPPVTEPAPVASTATPTQPATEEKK